MPLLAGGEEGLELGLSELRDIGGDRLPGQGWSLHGSHDVLITCRQRVSTLLVDGFDCPRPDLRTARWP